VDPVSYADAVNCQRCLQIVLQVRKYCLKSDFIVTEVQYISVSTKSDGIINNCIMGYQC